MSRLRYNGLSTTLGGSLTNVATAVTFASALTHSGGTNVPTLSGGDYIPLSILNTSSALTEVVYLTAYTAAATTGTISRGQEGTAGVTHTAGDAVVSAPLVVDMEFAQLATKTANYGLTSTDSVIIANGSSLTITLPSAVTVGITGKPYVVKNIHSTTCTLASTAGTIDGSATQSLAQYVSLSVVSDGTNWQVI